MKLTCLPPRLSTAGATRFTGLEPVKRGSAHSRGYDHRWQKARARFLREFPLCRFCFDQGKIVEASVVDHIKPHQGNDRLFWDEDNWQALCKPCHDSVKAKIEHDAGYRG